MKKRIISVFMIIAMLCSVFPSVMAQSGLALTVTADKDNVNIGDELILTVSIKNAENIGKIQYTLNFDSNMLAYTEYTYGNTVKNNAYAKSVKKANESNLGFAAVFVNKPLNGDEELCSFKFTVKDTAVDGRINYSVVNEKIGTGAVDAVALPEGSITYDEVMVSGTGVTNTLSVTADKTQAESGQTVKYSIEITPNELEGIQFDFTYDNTVFELDEFIFNEDIENVLMSDYNDMGGSIRGMLAFSEATALSGQLAEAVFKVKESAPLGVTRVGIGSIKAKGAAGDKISIAAGNTPAVEINGIANPSLRFSTDKLVYMRGETVNIILHADNVVDFEGCQFTFEYNNEVFELDGECEALDMAEEALIADANTDEAGKIKAMLAFDTASAVTGSGDLYKIPLKVKGNSVYGSYGFNISEFKAKPENITAPTINGVEVRANSSSVKLAITNSTQRAAAGDEVEYSIDLIDAAAIKGIQFDMKYDASRLELVSVTDGMANEASMNTDNVGEINVLHLFDIGSSFSGNGNLFKVIFKVKENAPVGTAAVEVENIKSDAEITYTAADSLEIYDNTVSLIVSASSDSTFAAKGDELKIKVGLKSNIEIGGVQMIFDYDDTALEYVGADFSGFNSNNNPMSSQCNNLGDGKLGLITVLRDAAIIDDTFAELTFNVKESAEKGRLDYNIINITDVNENPEAYSAETELSDIRIINRFSSLKADVSAAEVMPGEEVKFKIILSDLDEAEGIQFELKYDTDAFAFVGYEESDFISEVRNFGEPATETDGLITVLYAFSEPQSGDENEIGTLVLKAKDSYEAGNTTVTFNEVKLPVTIGSEHSIGVPVKTVDATVYIKNDNDLAEIVMGLIESIGNVTLNSKDAIERAEAAYAELTDEQKALVNNYNVLTTARTTYDRLLADKTAADEVIEAISAIGNVTLESNG